MTSPEDTSLLPWFGGTYKLDKAAYDAPGGPDDCREVCEARIREVIRVAGHEPFGRVLVEWHERDPDVDPATPVEPGKMWAVVRIQVRPGNPQ